MKRIKKLQAAIVAFACVFMFSVCAVAGTFTATLDLGDGTGSNEDIISGSVGATVSVPVNLSSSGGEVGGVACTLEYDSAKLEFVEIVESDGDQVAVDPVAENYCGATSCSNPFTSGLSKSALFFQSNDQSGKLLIAAASAQAVANGEIFKVNFKILASGETTINNVQTVLSQNTSAGYTETENPIDKVVGMPSLTSVDGKYPVEDTFNATLTGVKIVGGGTVSGDMNGDGQIKSQDALLILHLLAGNISIGDISGDTDVNKDGKTNSADALYILHYVAGNITTFP